MPTLPIDTRRINTQYFRFTPAGHEQHFGQGYRNNPVDDFTGSNYAARLFIGFNVGQAPTWGLKDVMTLVRDMREKQGQPPDATYLATKGVFTHASGEVVTEEGCQVVIFDLNEGAAVFQRNILALAEALVRSLDQEAIYVEIQKNGIQTGLFRARP